MGTRGPKLQSIYLEGMCSLFIQCWLCKGEEIVKIDGISIGYEETNYVGPTLNY
jgi:hypothetical protein